MAAHSYAGFAGFMDCMRRYWLICCQIILFVCLLFLLIALLRPSYILTNGNDNAYSNNNNHKASTQRNDDFPTQIRNKLDENPNSQQEAQQHLNRSVAGAVVGVVISGLLDDHNNLPKSRIAAGRDYGVKNAWHANSSTPAEGTAVVMDDVEISTIRAWSQYNSEVNSCNAVDNRSSVQNSFQLTALGNILKRRQKKFIIFNGGGTVKYLVAVSIPIILPNPQHSISHYYNIQSPHVPLPRPLYWWDFFNSSTFAARRQQRQLTEATPVKLHPKIKHDASREYIYEALEQIFQQHGIPGESCLLQAICEVSQLPFHVPHIWRNDLRHLWHAMVNAILIPTVPNVDMKYLHASQAGRFGVDCQQAFSECPQTVNEWLRRVANMV
ncbi:uncharacterized protein LOC105217754 [Zeugodacus cucurbitae]|uniref:Uncharacterized protein n=1 Tax=Zeugodacus cucurbitae TaxID=28588 RepID=A0A0A1WVJ1_ZEUCU|nr:uncharacterized protein LOC105217754 [Zeugodacus cucurbitae]